MKPDVLDKLIALFVDVCQRMIEQEERVHLDGRDHAPDEEAISDALRRLKLGEITTAEYLDIKVDSAMKRLRDVLPDDDFRYVRAMIRDRVETDPVLVGLLQRLIAGNVTRPPYN